MRIEYPGAIDHVLSRGDHREAIFVDDGDCRDFIMMNKIVQKHGLTPLTL